MFKQRRSKSQGIWIHRSHANPSRFHSCSLGVQSTYPSRLITALQPWASTNRNPLSTGPSAASHQPFSKPPPQICSSRHVELWAPLSVPAHSPTLHPTYFLIQLELNTIPCRLPLPNLLLHLLQTETTPLGSKAPSLVLWSCNRSSLPLPPASKQERERAHRKRFSCSTEPRPFP